MWICSIHQSGGYVFHKDERHFRNKFHFNNYKFNVVIKLSIVGTITILSATEKKLLQYVIIFTITGGKWNVARNFNHPTYLDAAGGIAGLLRKPTLSSSLSVTHTKKQVGNLHDFF